MQGMELCKIATRCNGKCKDASVVVRDADGDGRLMRTTILEHVDNMDRHLKLGKQ